MKNGLEIDSMGTKRWYLNGFWHREGEAAIEYSNGDKSYYLYGNLHREDGPALEYTNNGVNYKYWYFYGKEIKVKSTEEFLRMLKLKAFW